MKALPGLLWVYHHTQLAVMRKDDDMDPAFLGSSKRRITRKRASRELCVSEDFVLLRRSGYIETKEIHGVTHSWAVAGQGMVSKSSVAFPLLIKPKRQKHKT